MLEMLAWMQRRSSKEWWWNWTLRVLELISGSGLQLCWLQWVLQSRQWKQVGSVVWKSRSSPEIVTLQSYIISNCFDCVDTRTRHLADYTLAALTLGPFCVLHNPETWTYVSYIHTILDIKHTAKPMLEHCCLYYIHHQGRVPIQDLHPSTCAFEGQSHHNAAQRTIPIHWKSRDAASAHLKCFTFGRFEVFTMSALGTLRNPTMSCVLLLQPFFWSQNFIDKTFLSTGNRTIKYKYSIFTEWYFILSINWYYYMMLFRGALYIDGHLPSHPTPNLHGPA